MTTLATGASAAVILKDGGVCTIATNGGLASVTVTPTGGVPSTVNIGPLPARQAFGPYPEGAVVVIANQSAALDYDSPATNSTRILAQSGVPSSVTGTLVETVLATITIPGGLMGPNGSLRITPIFSITNNANTKTLSAKLGASSVFTIGLTANAAYQAIATVRNRNSQASQVSTNGGGYGPVFIATSAVDTSVDQLLTISGTLANAADTITLEGYTVEVLPAY